MQKAAGAVSQMMALEELAVKNTALHRRHPLAKLITTILYVAVVVSVDRLDFMTLSLYFFYPAFLLPIAEIPFGMMARRVLVALPFVIFAGLSNVLFETAPYMQLSGIVISRGVVSLIVLVGKTVLTVSAILILMATTKAAQVFSSLQRIGVPKVLVTVLMLGFRYLSLLFLQTDRMTRAYHLRAKSPKGIAMKDMGSFAGQLLLLSFDRAERVYKAMKLRGFDGSFTAAKAGPMSKADLMFIALVCALILTVRVFPLAALFA